jgi:hypothetical protein
VEAMRARRPDLQAIEVADQGHVPLLEGDDLLREIVGFVAACDVASGATAEIKPAG